jgi:hypothetical protein
VTIEKESEKSAINVVRIYFNYRENPDNVSYKTLPIPSSVSSISVCPLTARIAVSTSSTISIFEISKLGAGELLLEVDLESQLEISKVVLYNSFLGFAFSPFFLPFWLFSASNEQTRQTGYSTKSEIKVLNIFIQKKQEPPNNHKEKNNTKTSPREVSSIFESPRRVFFSFVDGKSFFLKGEFLWKHGR